MDIMDQIHCYLLHSFDTGHRLTKKKELFGLQRRTGNSHFITSMTDENELKQDNVDHDINRKRSNVVPSINFGTSVLKWLDYLEEPTFDGLHNEIIQNPQSTINEEIFLNFAQESYIKMKNNKSEQYLLDEMISIKMYTDSNSFQSSLRKSHWKSSDKKIKKSFYQWAMQLYKASLFHSKPIPRCTLQSKAPQSLYHGLNRVFVLDNARPKYNGPTSTSLEKSVAHSFSKGSGLLWTIKPSYSNRFKFITGISVSWISHHKNEAEVFLMDQYLPITFATNFEQDAENNVDHLLYSIKSYKKQIFFAKQFYNLLGITFNKSWIPLIEKNKILYDDTHLFGSKKVVIQRLIEELQMDQLKQYKALSSKFNIKVHSVFNCFELNLKINNEYEISQILDILFSNNINDYQYI